MIFQEEVIIPELSGPKPRKLFIYLPDEELDYEDLPEEDGEEIPPEDQAAGEESCGSAEEETGGVSEEELPGSAGPDDREEQERRYPVLYMFDGHNVFFDATATYGKSWGMKEYLEENHIPVIVAAVECNHEGIRRLEEYSPYPGEIAGDTVFKPQGKVTMEWFVNELKPMVDEWFPTLPDREHTAIAGSSMGGLMALYAVSRYNHVFSMAAGLSPSVMMDSKKLLADIRRSEIGEHTRVYMDYGTEEGGSRPEVYELLEKVQHAFLRKGANTCLRVIDGGKHCEASWEKQIPVFLRHLGLQ